MSCTAIMSSLISKHEIGSSFLKKKIVSETVRTAIFNEIKRKRERKAVTSECRNVIEIDVKQYFILFQNITYECFFVREPVNERKRVDNRYRSDEFTGRIKNN